MQVMGRGFGGILEVERRSLTLGFWKLVWCVVSGQTFEMSTLGRVSTYSVLRNLKMIIPTLLAIAQTWILFDIFTYLEAAKGWDEEQTRDPNLPPSSFKNSSKLLTFSCQNMTQTIPCGHRFESPTITTDNPYCLSKMVLSCINANWLV